MDNRVHLTYRNKQSKVTINFDVVLPFIVIDRKLFEEADMKYDVINYSRREVSEGKCISTRVYLIALLL